MRRSDPHLAAMSAYSAGCPRDNGMAAPEQVAPEPASRSHLQPAAAWSVAALITLAAAISVLLSKTVAGATASAAPARATAKPSQHHPGPQPRRARARAHAHRVMTAHAVEVAARARRSREGSPSARHSWGDYWWCAAFCAVSMSPPPVAIGSCSVTRSVSAVTRARPQDRPHPARTAAVCRPRKPAFRPVTQLPLAVAGHLVTVGRYILLKSHCPVACGR